MKYLLKYAFNLATLFLLLTCVNNSNGQGKSGLQINDQECRG